jgi:hypothetical protein
MALDQDDEGLDWIEVMVVEPRIAESGDGGVHKVRGGAYSDLRVAKRVSCKIHPKKIQGLLFPRSSYSWSCSAGC